MPWPSRPSKGLPDGVREPVAPGYCRLAVESILNDVIRRKLYDMASLTKTSMEQINVVTTLNTRSASALFGDSSRGADALSRLGAFGKNAGTLTRRPTRVSTRDTQEIFLHSCAMRRHLERVESA